MEWTANSVTCSVIITCMTAVTKMVLLQLVWMCADDYNSYGNI